MFAGFPEETIRFFLDIRFHNDISFYRAHEQEYRTYVKEPFYSLIEELGPTMLTIDPEFDIRPGKCLARLRRDTRFTKDKSPYRDHLWLLFHRSGEARDTSVMYWFELGPDRMQWGLGFWGQNRPAMDALRRKMEQNPQLVRRVLRQAKLPDEGMPIQGERYQRMKAPAGMPIDLAMLYPMKEIFIPRIDVPWDKCYQSDLTQLVKADFLRLKPMYQLLRAAADEGMAQPDA